MKALIFQTMLALLIPGLSNTPKQALTPPTAFDYSYKLQGPAGADPIWNFKNESTGLYSSIYWTRTINNTSGYDYDTGYLNLAGFTDIEWRLRTFYTDSAFFLVGDNYYQPWYNYIGTSSTDYGVVKYRYEFTNLSQYNYYIYFDMSSTGQSLLNIQYFSLTQIPPYQYQTISTSVITDNVLLLPAFTTVNMFNSAAQGLAIKMDAIYFDKLPITQGMGGYGWENYYEGYNEGYTTAYDEFGNFDWLSSLFVTMGDLLAIEILPGITIGLILLIPIVFGVLRFIMGLFR